MTRDEVNDSGEIPAAVGETTQRLRVDIATGVFPLVVRSALAETTAEAINRPETIGVVDQPRPTRPAAVLDLIGACRRIDTSDPDEFEVLPTSPIPMPVPPPPPDPQVDEVWEAPIVRPPVGRHRRPSRWDWLTVPLAMAWQRIGQAL
jgi:hypothetical protein